MLLSITTATIQSLLTNLNKDFHTLVKTTILSLKFHFSRFSLAPQGQAILRLGRELEGEPCGREQGTGEPHALCWLGLALRVTRRRPGPSRANSLWPRALKVTPAARGIGL